MGGRESRAAGMIGVAILLLLTARRANAECEADAACPAGRTCERGECREAQLALAETKPTENLFVDGYIAGSFLVATMNGGYYTMYGAGLEVGFAVLVGLSEFPEHQGGVWHGLVLETLASAHGGAVIGQGATGGFFAAGGAALVGYEFDRLGGVDAATPKRGGIGGLVGVRGGFEWTPSTAFAFPNSGADGTIGGTLALVFPRFDAQRSRFLGALISFEVWALPQPGITFYTLGGGARF